jgi:hypothetical protein
MYERESLFFISFKDAMLIPLIYLLIDISYTRTVDDSDELESLCKRMAARVMETPRMFCNNKVIFCV